MKLETSTLVQLASTAEVKPGNIYPAKGGKRPGTEYWLVIQNAAGDSSNYVAGETDTGCDYEEGTLYSSNGTTWGNSDNDRGFKYRLYE